MEQEVFYQNRMKGLGRIVPIKIAKPVILLYILFFLTIGAPILFIIAAFIDDAFPSMYGDAIDLFKRVYHGRIEKKRN